MILGANGIKMGKRYPKYCINPSDIVREYGADTLRLYEMFMGPLEADKPWSMQGVEGIYRWLLRVWRLLVESKAKLTAVNDGKLDYVYNYTVKKVSEDIDSLNLNTAISQLMIFINECYKQEQLYLDYAIDFVQLLSCFAPHIACEIYEKLTGKQDLAYRPWPQYDPQKLVLETIEIVVQINGKIRARFNGQSGMSEEELLQAALAQDNIKKFTDGTNIKKYFVIRGKMLNIVI